MTISGCQVEPIGSLYEWEREPLAIIKDGCQADHVGLVCPPQRTDYGVRVTVESFRYQTTAQVQYSCLVRICPFAPCPVVRPPKIRIHFKVHFPRKVSSKHEHTKPHQQIVEDEAR